LTVKRSTHSLMGPLAGGFARRLEHLTRTLDAAPDLAAAEWVFARRSSPVRLRPRSACRRAAAP
jgi:hypothetical protein